MLSRWLAWYLSFLCLAAVPANSKPPANTNDILNTAVSSFAREKVGMGDIAMVIATEFSIPVGFEGLPEDPERMMTVALKDTTIKDLLDYVIRMDPRYEWKLVDGHIINIYPRDKAERFLDAMVPEFKVDGKTRSFAIDELTQTSAFAQILTKLHARLRTMASPNRNALGPEIGIDMHNASVREILNAIVIASHGTAWSAVRYGDHLQYLSFGVGG